ncbi:hypothetical protein H8A99_28695 [Bradyrhizobium sp. Arg68]|uniref:hypothetical protein n=1 Tax=Bradyrhizobium ivorense TaxID=2511166 RepID=UPI001E61CE1A|nr:hypothetical protein [Bradyrhizobium ivorense]MCC8940330.1 hypothetical protein [Bradyrhizobium ivorense]
MNTAKPFTHTPLSEAERVALQKDFDRALRRNGIAFNIAVAVVGVFLALMLLPVHEPFDAFSAVGALLASFVAFACVMWRPVLYENRSRIMPLDVDGLEALAKLASASPALKGAVAQWFDNDLTVTRHDLLVCELFASELAEQQRKSDVLSKLHGRAVMFLTMPGLIAHGPDVPDAPWMSSPAVYTVAAIVCSLLAAHFYKRRSPWTILYVICAMSALVGIVASSKT